MERGAVREGTLDWRGSDVWWTQVGQGPAVVLCHGTPWSSYSWRRIATDLAEFRTVYMWDMLGYGRSAKPDDDVSLRAQGEILAALVAHWGLESPALVAHDFGGAVALRSHLLHDVSLASLALVDVVALRPWGSPFFKLVADYSEVFAQLPPNLHEALIREYISGASSRGLASETLDALVAPWLGEDGQAAFYRQIAQADELFTDEVEPSYRGIAVPTLIVWGSDDSWIPVDRGHRLREMIPGSQLEVVEGAGHLIQEDRPAELAAHLVDWLRG